jgi:glyoxylase-like metal-dependent hydrolase (beta-lactamase superfamily II)
MVTVVRVVLEGWLRRENGVLMEAHSTATLVVTTGHNILVDTSTKQQRTLLLQGLRSEGLRPGDIDMLVNTHLHLDHIGNNDLFTTASKMAREEEGPDPSFVRITEDAEIAPGIGLMHTPGHSPGSMSVVVETDGRRYVIAGDAIPTRDNYEKWLPPMIHYDREVALESMRRIREIADVIIPGHGNAFEP